MTKPLEARIVRVLRRWFSPELAARVAREVAAEPEAAPLPPPTELELRRVERAARGRGLLVRGRKR